MKATLYSTATVLPGNKIEIQASELAVGQKVEVIILVTDSSPNSPSQNEQTADLSLSDRLAFLKLPLAERRSILESQTEQMIEHYQQNSEWQDLMAGDIIDY